MDLEVRRVPVGADFRADVAALDAAIDADTIMLVGSAPSFPYGGIDPIAELGALAEKRNVWLHVDACVGGYLAPFAKRIGRAIPDFDFTVPQESRRCRPTCTSSASARSRPRRCSIAMPTRRSTTTSISASGRTAAS